MNAVNFTRARSSMVEQYPLKVFVGGSNPPGLTESNSAPPADIVGKELRKTKVNRV